MRFFLVRHSRGHELGHPQSNVIWETVPQGRVKGSPFSRPLLARTAAYLEAGGQSLGGGRAILLNPSVAGAAAADRLIFPFPLDPDGCVIIARHVQRSPERHHSLATVHTRWRIFEQFVSL